MNIHKNHCDNCQYEDEGNAYHRLFALRHCSHGKFTIDPVFLSQIEIVGCASFKGKYEKADSVEEPAGQ